MFISIYQNSTDTIGVEADHIKVLSGIQSGRWKVMIENLRALLQSGSEEDYSRSKRQLPAATFGGTFAKREASALTRYSGLIILDIDNLNEFEVQEYKNAFKLDTFIYSCFISPSLRGLKILVKLESNQDNHLQAFLALEKHFKDTYAVALDKSGKDLSRLCYVSYDPDIYINEDSEVFSFAPEEFIQNTSNQFDKRPDRFKGYILSKDAKYAFGICEKWTQRHHQYEQGNRNNYIHVLACNLNRAGVFVDDTMLMIYNSCSDLDFKEVEQTVNSAYKNNSREHNSIDIYNTDEKDLPDHHAETETMSQQEEIIYLDTMAFLESGMKINVISKYIKNFGTTFLGQTEENVKAIMNQAFAAYKATSEESFTIESADKTLESVLENFKDDTGVSTNVIEFDAILRGGLMPGNLYGAIGDGGSFKSVFAHCVGSTEANVTAKNNLVVYLNGEMSELQLMDRVMNKELGIDLQDMLKAKTINKTNIAEYTMRLKEVLGENFQIVSSSGWNSADILKKVKEIEQKLNKKATLLIIDGLTQMEDIKKDEIKSAIHNSGQLKELAKDTNTAVICLVHVSGNPPKHYRDTASLIRGGTKLINNMDAMFCMSRLIDEGASNMENADYIYREGIFYVRFIDKRGTGKVENKIIQVHRPLRLEVLAIDPQMMEVNTK